MAPVPDRYLLPNGTLRNKLGGMNAAALAQREGQIVAARELQLRGRDSPSPRSLQALRAIHRHLFQDIYDWAGEFRTVDLMKETEVGGPISAFTPCRSLAERCCEIDGNSASRRRSDQLFRVSVARRRCDTNLKIQSPHRSLTGIPMFCTCSPYGTMLPVPPDQTKAQTNQ